MKTQDKVDLFKLHKDQYAAPRKPVIVEVPAAKYLTIVGRGAPGGPLFGACIGALYGAAFTVKMTRKFGGQQDYVVCKLEAQWWTDLGPDLGRAPMEEWSWRLMIRTPDFVTDAELRQAAEALTKRGKGAEVDRVLLESLEEGACVQMLHVGPYDKEGETVAVMQAFAEKKGLEFHGCHHEIYLSDPRRVLPEKLKTILRVPVRPALGC